MKIDRDDIVALLREWGRDEEADRALEKLPKHVNVHQFEAELRSFGLDPEQLTSGRPFSLPPGVGGGQ